MCGTSGTERLEKPICIKNHCSPVDIGVNSSAFDGISLLVFATGKPLKGCEQYLFSTKTVLWTVSVL